MGYTHGTRWSFQKMCDEVNKVRMALNLKRMPSNKECVQVTGNMGLSNKIAKSGGFYYMAKKMGLEIKDSETFMGSKYETVALEILESKGYKVQKMSTRYPFDLLVNDCVKIDVKAGTAYMLRESRVHTFGINKKYPTCDIYLIFALDENEKIERTFLVPANQLKLTSLNIGKESKYNKYIDKWEYIDEFYNFYEHII